MTLANFQVGKAHPVPAKPGDQVVPKVNVSKGGGDRVRLPYLKISLGDT